MAHETNLDGIAIGEVKGIFTTDIAGTLYHVVPGERGPDIIDLGKQRKLHRGTLERLNQIKENGMFIIGISGMRQSTYDEVSEFFPLDRIILEHGGIILDGRGNKEHAWETHLKQQIKAVQAYKVMVLNELPAESVVDYSGRETSFRIKPDDQNQYTLRTIVQTLSQLSPSGNVREEPLHIITTEFAGSYNIPVFDGVRLFLHSPFPPEYACIEVIPDGSGKRNAVSYLAQTFSMGWDSVIAFGDDLNDLDMLQEAHFAATFARTKSNHSRQNLLEAVRRKGSDRSFVTELSEHEGTMEVLDVILDRAIPMVTGGERYSA